MTSGEDDGFARRWAIAASAVQQPGTETPSTNCCAGRRFEATGAARTSVRRAGQASPAAGDVRSEGKTGEAPIR